MITPRWWLGSCGCRPRPARHADPPGRRRGAVAAGDGAPSAARRPATPTVGGTDSLPTGSRVGQTDPLPPPWQATELAWVAAQASPNTRRHYRTSWVAFQQFMGGDADPLRITSDDVNAWIASLRARGQAASTIASRVAACASLFDFIARHAPELLTDRHGRLRSNPFRNEAVRRPRVKSANGPQPLADATVQGLLGRINTDCLSGARDQAFLLTALTTGWQTAALVGLRWAGRRAAEDGAFRPGATLCLRGGAALRRAVRR